MIKSVYGIINDIRIDFVKQENNEWQATIPKIEGGRYYTELYAVDDAGNASFVAHALFEINPACTTMSISIIDTEFSNIVNDVDIETGYEAMDDENLESVGLENEYSLEVVECKLAH